MKKAMTCLQIISIVTVVLLCLLSVAPVMYLAMTGDYPGQSVFYNLPEDSLIVAILLEGRHICNASMLFVVALVCALLATVLRLIYEE